MNEWLLMQSAVVVYGVLFTLLLTGALGFPPEDVTLILGGIVIHSGQGEPQIVFALCYIGTLLGDFFIYAVGRRFGPALYNKAWFKSRVRPGRIKLIKTALERRSFPMIFIARHLFYLRTVTFLTCGAVRMSFARFLVADCLSALVSVPLMLWIGFQASEHYDTVYNYLKRAKLFSLFLVVAALIAFGLYILYKKEEALEDEAEKEMSREGTLPIGEKDREG
jgi:membrane protein DedA with SNARE-associated domain